ncbi:hypothetical protein [Kiloniella laminariae]|uniref:hypothetical protein n=1 Tax=Kiloniella laminariae TaxID=454162 RepID=UPI000373C68A|nr:hypothetical protein [Kiloniella laminariae]
MGNTTIKLPVAVSIQQRSGGVEETIEVDVIELRPLKLKHLHSVSAERPVLGEVLNIVKKLVVNIPAKAVDEMPGRNCKVLFEWFSSEMGESQEAGEDL